MATPDQVAHGGASVAGPAQDVEQHSVRHLEPRHQPFRWRRNQPFEGLLVPRHEVLLRRLALHDLLPADLRFLLQFQVLDDVLRRLRDDPAAVIEALAPGAPGDLVEIARGEDADFLAAELAELREEHRADRHVDADAERIGPADDLEQSLLRELFDEDAILWQEPGVVQTDAVPQPLLDLRTVGAAELETLDRARYRGLLLARRHVEAREILRALPRFHLREVDDINGRFAVVDQLFERRGQREIGIGELQRNRPVLR